jgi:phosphoribosylformimino-5-aminoimidazole carboxamide ribotide isomerase
MRDATVYNPDPADAARQWVAQGAEYLHVVDLDGAFAGLPSNLTAVKQIAAAAGAVPVQMGGGLRSMAAIGAAMAAGVTRVIIGTSALSGGLVGEAVSLFGPDRVVVGIDAKGGMVATEGWVNVSAVPATELAARVKAQGVKTVIYTDIAKDGMMSGPNFEEMAVMGRTGLGIIASGGVSALDDIRRLMAIPGVTGAILGKALYTGAIDLKEALDLCR